VGHRFFVSKILINCELAFPVTEFALCWRAHAHILSTPELSRIRDCIGGTSVQSSMRANAHVIVLGNEKGGSGKSTTALHLAIYLAYEGYRVATIDTDSRQQTLTGYIANRRQWAKSLGVKIPQPAHFHLPQPRDDSRMANDRIAFEMFRSAITEVEGHVDFLIIDTPGFDTHLTRLAHSLADTLVTPLNDSLIDLDVIARVDPETGDLRELSHYTRLVQRARSERLNIDGRSIDWVLVRNRISMLGSRNTRLVQTGLENISARVGCRIADGIAERVEECEGVVAGEVSLHIETERAGTRECVARHHGTGGPASTAMMVLEEPSGTAASRPPVR
jgi:chromosome partitioning protein